jgi:hypothetical protein
MGHEDALRLRHPEVGPRMPMIQVTAARGHRGDAGR